MTLGTDNNNYQFRDENNPTDDLRTRELNRQVNELWRGFQRRRDADPENYDWESEIAIMTEFRHNVCRENNTPSQRIQTIKDDQFSKLGIIRQRLRNKLDAKRGIVRQPDLREIRR